MRIVAGRARMNWTRRWIATVAAGVIALSLATPFTAAGENASSTISHVEHMRSLVQNVSVSDVNSPNIPCPGGSGPCP